jgi:hypothetical protein
MFIQQWINALQMYWGGWLLFNYPNEYQFNDFLISNFAILFSLFGLGAAFQDISDRKETEKSASRIFYLLDRVSSIDPLSKEGKILDTSVDRPLKSQRKISIKRKSSTKAMKEQQKRKSSLDVVDESETTAIDETAMPIASEAVLVAAAESISTEANTPQEEMVSVKPTSKKMKKKKKSMKMK